MLALINRRSYADLMHGTQIDIALSPAQAMLGEFLAHVRKGDVRCTACAAAWQRRWRLWRAVIAKAPRWWGARWVIQPPRRGAHWADHSRPARYGRYSLHRPRALYSRSSFRAAIR